ncbi:MAG: hypothetical protein JXB50_12000 [Spirochaetes bacterium]|nr:hypothetical protein [Spirochaetota bacterium]
MKIKLTIFIVLTFYLSVHIFPEDIGLAKFYLEQSYNSYLNQSFKTADEFAEKSYQFYQKLPEYYYIKNLLYPDDKTHLSIKKKNADSIIKLINNSFLLEHFILYRQTADIYESTRNFTNAYISYIKVIDSINKTQEDYLNLIKMLFNSDVLGHLDLVPVIITNAKKFFNSLDLEYYNLKYRVLKKNIDVNEFINGIKLLEANSYFPSRILYLEVQYYYNQKKINELYSKYSTLKKNNSIESGYLKLILYELLLKAGYLTTNQTRELLNEWDKIAQNDHKTVNLLKITVIKNIIKPDKYLNEKFNDFTGARRKDVDLDGEWEEYFEYKNGIVVKYIKDQNQDGISEIEADFSDNGILKNYTLFNDKSDYKIYIFNEIDKSIKNIEAYKDDRLRKRYTLSTSKFFADIKNLTALNENQLLPITSYVEEFDSIYKKTKYYNGKKEYSVIDKNFNNKFEEKIIYKDDIIDEIYKDNDENGLYEVVEKYHNNKIDTIKYKSDEHQDNFYYTEKIQQDKIIKKWDNDFDNIYEVEIEEYPNGTNIKKIDIDYDGLYDYAYEYKKNILIKIYNLKTNKILKESNTNVKDVYISDKISFKWNIISAKDLKKIILPDNIIVSNKKLISGYYLYKNEKYYFENSIIQNKDFHYRLFYINDKLYLYDLQN